MPQLSELEIAAALEENLINMGFDTISSSDEEGGVRKRRVR